MPISLKFNNGNPALLFEGRGLIPIGELGLHTSLEVEALRQRAAKAESERDAALDREAALHNSYLSTVTELQAQARANTSAHAKLAAIREGERDALQKRVEELSLVREFTATEASMYLEWLKMRDQLAAVTKERDEALAALEARVPRLAV